MRARISESVKVEILNHSLNLGNSMTAKVLLEYEMLDVVHKGVPNPGQRFSTSSEYIGTDPEMYYFFYEHALNMK